MKPLVVLSLVLIAVAALVLTLWSLGDGGDQPAAAPVSLNQGSEGSLTAGEAPLIDTGLRPEDPALTRSGVALEAEPRIEVAAENGGSYANELRGTVRTTDGQPVAGAKVQLSRTGMNSGALQVLTVMMRPDAPAEPSLRTTTDEEGHYLFRSIQPARDYGLQVDHPAYSSFNFAPLAIGESSVQVQDVTLDSGYLLLGYVRDDAGNPIEGAKLMLDNTVFASMPGGRTSPELQETLSAEDGAYRFESVSPGTRDLTCSAEGFETRRATNLIFAGDKIPKPQDFRLEREQFLSGRVLGPDRAGIGKATIQVMSYDPGMPSGGVAISQPNGDFRVRGLAKGKYVLMVSAKGFRDERLNEVTAGETGLEIVLSQQGSVQGRVVDAASGQGLTSFRLGVRAVNPGTTTYSRAMVSQDFTSRDGSFSLAGVEGGTYVLEGQAAGYAPTFSESFSVTQGLITPDVIVHMSKGGTISGRVVDAHSGEPIAGAEVKTFENSYVQSPFTDLLGAMMPRNTTERTVRTNQEGRFTIDQITPEVYQIHISHGTHTLKVLNDLRVSDALTLELGVIELNSGAFLRGTVYGKDGQPLPYAKVTMRGNRPGTQYDVRADAEGRYYVSNVAEGSYRLSATSEVSNDNPFQVIIDTKSSEVSITVSEGVESTRDLYLGGR